MNVYTQGKGEFMHEFTRPDDPASLLSALALIMLKYQAQQYPNSPIRFFNFVSTKRGLCFCALTLISLKVMHHYQRKTDQNLFREQVEGARHPTTKPKAIG